MPEPLSVALVPRTDSVPGGAYAGASMTALAATPSAIPTTDVGGARPGPPSAPQTRIELAPYDLGAALALERELGISHVLAQVLVRRGHRTAADVRALLAADVEHPPSAFAGIETALELIERHIAPGDRITVHGDYDVDGVCATAIMVAALRELGAVVDWFMPGRTAGRLRTLGRDGRTSRLPRHTAADHGRLRDHGRR